MIKNRLQNYEDFRNFLKSYNITIITSKNEYSTLISSNYIKCTCSCGESYERTYNKLKRLKHKCCPTCSKKITKGTKSEAKRKNSDEILKLIENRGFIFIKGEYINQNSKLTFRCPTCMDTFERRVGLLKSTQPTCRCCSQPDHSFSKDQCIQQLNSREYKVLKFYNKDRVKIKCKTCGEPIIKSYNVLIGGKGQCKTCAKSIEPQKIEQIEEIIYSKHKHLKWVNGIYKNQNSILTLSCDCAEVFSTSFISLMGSTLGCPRCSTKQRTIKTRETREKLDHWIKLNDVPLKKQYYRQVEKFTRISKKQLDLNKIGRCSVDTFQVDHVYSKIEGFKNNILPWVIGHISNLKIIPSLDNASKSRKCGVSKNELFGGVGY